MQRLKVVLASITLMAMAIFGLYACGGETPTATPIPPTATVAPPPPTATTAVAPTDTTAPALPTATSVTAEQGTSGTGTSGTGTSGTVSGPAGDLLSKSQAAMRDVKTF